MQPTPPRQAPTPDTRRAAPRSLLRYASTEHGANSTSSSNMGQPIPTATASPSSLPTINNRILQHQAEKFQALQQQMLLEHLLSHQKPHVPCAEPVTEDDAPLPAARYGRMSVTLPPERDPQTFEAWQAAMQHKLQQHLRQQKQQPDLGSALPSTGLGVMQQGS